MKNSQRIAKNIIVKFIADNVSFVMAFFYTMYVIRYLGPKNYGILSFAIAFTAIFSVFTDIGLQQILIRDIARKKSRLKKYIENIAVLKMILSLITLAFIALTINLFKYPDETVWVVYIIALAVITNTFIHTIFSVFRAYEKMEFEAIGLVLSSLLMLGGALIAINHGLNVLGIAMVQFIVSIIILGYALLIFIRKYFIPKFQFDLLFCKRIISESWAFGLNTVFVVIIYWIDTVMLSVFKDNEEVGWYSAAYKLVFLLQFIAFAYSGALFPVMSKLFVTSKKEFRIVYEKSTKYLFIIAMPIGFGTTLLSKKIILLFFGKGYYPSILCLQILIWSLVIGFVTASINQLFITMNKQIISTWVLGICAVLNVILNMVLIPKYGIVGASIATTITGTIGLITALIWSTKIGYGLTRLNLSGISISTMCSCIAMCFFITLFKSWNLVILVGISAALYFYVLYLTKGIDKEDILIFRSIIKKEKQVLDK